MNYRVPSDSTLSTGPWALGNENRARRVIKSADPKPRTICIIEDWVREADARLLGAAFDLLAACEVAVNSPACALGGHERQQILAAIAKARGGQ